MLTKLFNPQSSNNVVIILAIPLVMEGNFCYNTSIDAPRRNRMRKRLLCCLLAVLILTGSLVGLAPRTLAADDMTTSQQLIDVLKRMEGFAPRAYWDHSQWTVGYGTRCPNDMLDDYDASTGRDITEEEAEELLQKMLKDFEDEVNNFIDRYDLSLTQYEFDALVSFTYNCGGAWTYNSKSSLSMAIRAGLTGTNLIYALCLYSMADTSYSLVHRRLSEAYLFLEGQYEAYNDSSDGTYPYRYRYVFLDGNGGDMLYAIHGYTAADSRAPKSTFTRIPTGIDADGNPFIYTFAGWYTAPSGGTKVETLDGSLSNGTILYAQWADPNGQIVSLPKGTVVDNVTATVQSQVNVRSGPGTFYPKTGHLSEWTTVTITQTYEDDDLLWGKFDGGWICLNYTDYSAPAVSQPSVSGLSLVKGPADPQCVQGQVITNLDGSVLKISYSDGTIGAMTLNTDLLSSYDTDSLGQTTVSATYGGHSVSFPVDVVMATVTFCNEDGTVISRAQYELGDTVTVPEAPAAESNATFVGWSPKVTACNGNQVYTAVFTRDEVPEPSHPEGSDPTEPPEQTDPTDPPEPTDPPAPPETPQWPRTGIITGREVNVRTGPGTQYNRADYQLNPGNLVVIQEVVYDGRTYNWGRMEDGHWVCMDYVKLLNIESSNLPGDMNGDGIINKDDAIYLLRHVVFPDKYPVTIEADVNADNAVNKDDAIYLLRHVVFPDKYPLIYG